MKRFIIVTAVIALVAVAVFGGQAIAGKPEKAPDSAALYDLLLTMNLTLSDIKEQGDSIENKVDTIFDLLPPPECVADVDCELCEECHRGVCINQLQGSDVKEECPSGDCVYGYCNGLGACAIAPQTDCGTCAACLAPGQCLYDEGQDADCPDTDCDSLDGCVGDDYWDYNDVPNECVDIYTCSADICSVSDISTSDPRCTQ